MRVLLIAAAVVLILAGSPGPAGAETFRECPQCPEMVAVPAGKFLMGSPAHEPGRFDSEGPQHPVSIKAFALGQYPVTSEEFLIFLRASRYRPEPCNPILGLGWKVEGRDLAYPPSQDEPPRWPAVCLSWKDANAYITWLNQQVKAAHPVLASRAGPGPYRLPSEAEWEYAARAGT
ncbi:MAG TPA: formylglycine-generating enzyme family protein, partial [Rhizomicrobium sp.]|nr:formylglycine-generating enzyme family protein [Rhizomicrobium sp.]